MKSILCLCIIFSFLSCEKKEMIKTPAELGSKFGDLQVEVLKCADNSACEITSPITGANVYIYNSIEDQEFARNESRFGQTNAEGKVKFTALDSFIVYISVIHDTFIYESFERLPPNSTSLHHLQFD